MTTPSTYHNTEEVETGQYCIGIGGCGNNLVDAILLRQEMDVDGDSFPKRIWENILAGQGMLNNNAYELSNTSYFSDIKTGNAEHLASEYVFGPGEGAGYNWQRGRELFRNHLDSASSWNDAWGDDLHLSSIQDSQSIWLLHSACGGTGAGATPEIAKSLRKQFDDELDANFPNNKPIISFPVFGTPRLEYQGNPLREIGGLVGLGRLSSYADAIIPLANDQINRSMVDIRCKINRNENWVPYEEENKTIVRFLELLGGAASREPSKVDAIDYGGEIDIRDTYRPAKAQQTMEEDHQAPILAPAVVKSQSPDNWDHTDLELLAAQLKHGKLINFDQSNAKGGVFIVCYPKEEKEGLNQIIHQEGYDILNNQIDFKYKQSSIFIHQIGFGGLDSVYLLALFWGSSIPRINKLIDVFRKYKKHDSLHEEEIDEYSEEIEDIIQTEL